MFRLNEIDTLLEKDGGNAIKKPRSGFSVRLKGFNHTATPRAYVPNSILEFRKGTNVSITTFDFSLI